jgi:hypothetical protein
MRKVTGTTKAWMTEYCGIGPEQLKSGDPKVIVKSLQFSHLDMQTEGWVLVGEAEITVTIKSTDEIVGHQVDALKAKKQNVLAQAEMEATQIERRIQELLAITYEPA